MPLPIIEWSQCFFIAISSIDDDLGVAFFDGRGLFLSLFYFQYYKKLRNYAMSLPSGLWHFYPFSFLLWIILHVSIYWHYFNIQLSLFGKQKIGLSVIYYSTRSCSRTQEILYWFKVTSAKMARVGGNSHSHPFYWCFFKGDPHDCTHFPFILCCRYQQIDRLVLTKKGIHSGISFLLSWITTHTCFFVVIFLHCMLPFGTIIHVPSRISSFWTKLWFIIYWLLNLSLVHHYSLILPMRMM